MALPATSVPPAAPPPLPEAPRPPARLTPRNRRLLRWCCVLLLGLLILLGLVRAGVEVYANYELRTAERYLGRQDYLGAKPHLEAALEVRPASPSLHLRLGRLCRQANQLDEAASHLARCRQLEGESEEYQLEVLMLQAQSGMLEQVFEKLFVYLEEKRPESSLILESVALALASQELFKPALATVERWLQLEPQNVQALYLKGGLLFSVGADPGVTAKILQKALDLDPGRDDIREAWAHALTEAQRFEDGATQYEIFLKKHPDDRGALAGLARCRSNQGDVEGAQQLLAQIGEEGDKDAAVLTERGRLAQLLNQPEEGERLLRRALAIDPNNQVANYHLELCLNQLGRREEAKAIADANRRREKDMVRIDDIINQEFHRHIGPALLRELGVLLIRNGRPSGVRWLYKALEADPHDPEIHGLLADYWDKHGEPERAARHREQAHPPGQ